MPLPCWCQQQLSTSDGGGKNTARECGWARVKKEGNNFELCTKEATKYLFSFFFFFNHDGE